MENFIELVAEVFDAEADSITKDTDFRKDIGDFSSLIGFSLIIMIEDEYGVRLSVDEFLKCKTVEDLYNKAMKK